MKIQIEIIIVLTPVSIHKKASIYTINDNTNQNIIVNLFENDVGFYIINLNIENTNYKAIVGNKYIGDQ